MSGSTFVTPEFLEAADRLTRARFPERLGFLLLDLTDARATLVHARRFLRQAGCPPGLRPEDLLPTRRDELLQSLNAANNYIVVAVTAEDGDVDPAAVGIIESVENRALPWFTIQRTAGGDVRAVDGATESADDARKIWSRPVDVQVDGVRPVADVRYLPFDLDVVAPQPLCTFKLQLRGAALGQHDFDVILRSRDQLAIGAGSVRVDVLLRPGKTDEVFLEPQHFERELELGFGVPVVFPSLPPLELHLLFDCTTVDPDTWPQALTGAYMHPKRESEGQWNLALRKEIGTALTDVLRRITRSIDVDLWWFADREHPDMVPFGASGMDQLSFYHHGTTRREQIIDDLTSRTFEYRPGLDLFDAVDEALLEISKKVLGRATDRQHAVVIIGDSPPPPFDVQDPLWTEVVVGPPATNARRSSAFRTALDCLKKAGVPVVWIFLLSLRERAHDNLYAHQHHDQIRLTVIKQRIASALERFDGLTVVSCAGMSELRGAIEKVVTGLADLDVRAARASVEFAGAAA